RNRDLIFFDRRHHETDARSRPRETAAEPAPLRLLVWSPLCAAGQVQTSAYGMRFQCRRTGARSVPRLRSRCPSIPPTCLPFLQGPRKNILPPPGACKRNTTGAGGGAHSSLLIFRRIFFGFR